jgi:hypothetical protein
MRCSGFKSADGVVAFCSRVESPKPAGDAFRHFNFGPCDCGSTHRAWEEAPPQIRERFDAGAQRANEATRVKPPKPWTMPESEIETTHAYTDPSTGVVLFEIVRTTKAARERGAPKTLPRHLVDGRWFYGAGPWAGRSDELPLYREAAVIAELQQGGVAHLVEGERDADRIHEAGGMGACNAWGAGSLREHHARILAAALRDGEPHAELVIVADRDDEGARHVAAVVAKLAAAGAPLDRVRLVQPRVGKDAADHLAAGHGLRDFEPFTMADTAPLVSEAVADSSNGLRLADLGFHGSRLLALLDRPRPDPIEAGRPVPGHFTLIVAPPFVGKSSLIQWSAMARAAGVAPWEGAAARPAGRVLLYTLDEAPEQVARRMHGLSTFHAAGSLARCADRLVVIGPDREIDPSSLDALRFDEAGLATLQRWLEDAEAEGDPFAEVYVDAYADVLPAGETENSNEEATRIGGALERLAVRFGCAVVVLHHAGKPPRDAKGDEPDIRSLSRGASALAAKARVLASLEIVEGMPHVRRLRTKTNLGPTPRSVLFEVASSDGADDDLLYFKLTADAPTLDPHDYITPGETISTNTLARRLAGEALEEGSDPPGVLKKRAAALREEWRRAGLIEPAEGANKQAKSMRLRDTREESNGA